MIKLCYREIVMRNETKVGNTYPEKYTTVSSRAVANQYLAGKINFLTAAEELDTNFPAGHYLIAELGILESVKRQNSKSLNLSRKYLEEIYRNPIVPYNLKFEAEFRYQQLDLIDLTYIQKKAPSSEVMDLFQASNIDLIQRYSLILQQIDDRSKYHNSDQYQQIYGHFNELLLTTLINRRYHVTNRFALPTLINDDHGGDLLNKTVESSFDIKILSTDLNELHKIQLKTSRNEVASFLSPNPLNIKLVFFKEDLARIHEVNLTKKISLELISDALQPQESITRILDFRYKKLFQIINY